MKERLLFKSYFGSRLYGTNSESSDIDFKGVFLPDKDDLILGIAPKHYTISTSTDGKRNTKDDIDETYYSLHYFLELLSSGETNALDLFFANTNKDTIVYEDPIWKELTNNADKLITKNINRYLGFCRSQAIRYSVKGEKLENYNKLKVLLEDAINRNSKDQDGAWITLRKLLISTYGIYNIAAGDYEDYKKNDKVIGKRVKYMEKIFGDHSYILEMNNGETYLMISSILYNFEDSIVEVLHKVNKTIKQYGKRAEIAASQNGADHKALSHAIRVLFQAADLITKGRIEFPLSKERTDFIKSIKYNQTNMTYEEIVDYIDKGIKRINEELLPNSNLRISADSEWIKQFILKLYK